MTQQRRRGAARARRTAQGTRNKLGLAGPRDRFDISCGARGPHRRQERSAGCVRCPGPPRRCRLAEPMMIKSPRAWWCRVIVCCLQRGRCVCAFPGSWATDNQRSEARGKHPTNRAVASSLQARSSSAPATCHSTHAACCLHQAISSPSSRRWRHLDHAVLAGHAGQVSVTLGHQRRTQSQRPRRKLLLQYYTRREGLSFSFP
jgi:hypothetical protein